MVFFRRWLKKAELEIHRLASYKRYPTNRLLVANRRLVVCSQCQYRDQAKCGVNGNSLKVLTMGSITDCPKGIWKE